MALVDPYCKSNLRFISVVDADALLSSIDNQCRKGWKPRMLRLAASGESILFAEDHVFGEVYRGFDKLARTSPVAPATVRACFEDHYLPVLRWVQTDGNGTNDVRVSQVTDATDVPTAELASLIAPCLVLAEDKSLRRPGYAPSA